MNNFESSFLAGSILALVQIFWKPVCAWAINSFIALDFHTPTRLGQVHGHSDDLAYQQMILHVVLCHNPQLPPLVCKDGQMISIVKTAAQLPKKWEQLVPDGAALLKEYDHLPGHCGSLLLEIG